MKSDERASSPRLHGDSGAALLEGALVALPFFILIFGMFEYGLVFKSYLSLASGTTTSGRAAATFGSELRSDYMILRAINEGAGGIDRETIHTIVIWHATGPGDTPPAGCVSGTGSAGTGSDFVGACNVYDYTDFGWDEVDFDCNSGTAGPVDYNWCPLSRKNWLNAGPSGRPAGTNFVGVYVEADYQMITGMFGTGMSFSETSITRIEAQGLTP